MHVLIPILAGAAIKAGSKMWKDHQRSTARKNPVAEQPKWSSVIECPHTPEHARRLIRRFLREHGASYEKRAESASIYSRGDPTITRLPTDRDVNWHDVPVCIVHSDGTIGDNGHTEIGVAFQPISTLSFSEHAADQFRDLARKEFARIIDYLNDNREHTQRSHADPSAEIRSDLEALGLALSATWEQIQAAYRELCRKYHPDRFSDQSIDPHLVELAQQRFAEIAAAYQRLRSRMSSKG